MIPSHAYKERATEDDVDKTAISAVESSSTTSS